MYASFMFNPFVYSPSRQHAVYFVVSVYCMIFMLYYLTFMCSMFGKCMSCIIQVTTIITYICLYNQFPSQNHSRSYTRSEHS